MTKKATAHPRRWTRLGNTWCVEGQLEAEPAKINSLTFTEEFFENKGMTVVVLIEFSSSPDFGSTKETGNKVMMMQQKIEKLGNVKVKVKRVLERNKMDVTVGDTVVHSQLRDGNLTGEKMQQILDFVSAEIEKSK